MLWFTSYWANQHQSLSVWVNNAYGFVASFNQLDSTHSIFMNKIIHQMFHISFHQSLNVLTCSYDWIGYYWHRAKREPNVCVSYWQSEMCSGCQRLSSGSDWKEQSIFLWFEHFLFSFPFQDDERWMVSWIRVAIDSCACWHIDCNLLNATTTAEWLRSAHAHYTMHSNVV